MPNADFESTAALFAPDLGHEFRVPALKQLRAHPATTHLASMFALTFSTGTIDAVVFLRLDRVFPGNMMGNVVLPGMGLIGGSGPPGLGPAIAVAAAVTLGVVIIEHLAHPSRGPRVPYNGVITT